jgi:hypothetical protein
VDDILIMSLQGAPEKRDAVTKGLDYGCEMHLAEEEYCF